jgi:cell pole-organizing protein PopZ
MSSTERAPEPTMEEILASIRRIISEDESSVADERATSLSPPDVEDLVNGEDHADNQTIHDLARALGGSAPAPEAEEEDILDLTAELGGLEPVEDAWQAEAAASEFTPSRETAIPETAPALGPEMEAVPASRALEPPAPAAAPEPVSRSASDEAASALERAIAALRAGQVPTSLTDLMSQPQSRPEPVFQTQPEPEQPALQTEPEPEPQPAPEEPSEPETQFVLTEFEETVITEETVVIEAVEDEIEEASADQPSLWIEPSETLPEPEPSGRSNGSGAHQAVATVRESVPAAKTLEDLVRDMLRPMLRQWLDENMSRVLTSALRDELKNDPARFQRD